jgi:hypothetical protein
MGRIFQAEGDFGSVGYQPNAILESVKIAGRYNKADTG